MKKIYIKICTLVEEVLKKENVLFNKNKEILLYTLIGIIFIFPFLAPHFALDSYTLIGGSYIDYAMTFFGAGRIVSALSYVIFSLLHLPFTTFSVLSTVFSVVILSFTIKDFVDIINPKYDKNKKLKYIFLCIITFSIFYNFMNIELFVFLESFIMFLGLYFIVKSVKYFLINKSFSKFISLIFLVLAISCYQGVLCIYIPLILLLIINKSKDIKDLIKQVMEAIIFYGISFLFSFLLIKLSSVILNSEEAKVVGINLTDNIIKIPSFIKDTFSSLFGLYSVKVFFGLIILLIFSIIFVEGKNKLKKIINLFLIILSIIIFAYVPNVFMSTTNNYVAPRMLCSIGMIIPLLVLYIYLNFDCNKNKITKCILIFVCMTNFIYTGINYIKNYSLSLKTYARDLEYVTNIENTIIKYQNKHKAQIKNIFYGTDSMVYYHYDDGVSNGFNYRVQAIDWAFMGLLDSSMNYNYNYTRLTKEETNKIFGDNKDYNKYDQKQLIFDKENLYILLY